MREKKIGICGAGIMGLTAAYELLKKGYDVTIFEKDDRVGGMSASFDFDGLTIERYYHFLCKPDRSVFEMLKELGIYEALKWRITHMGYFYEGKCYNWGNPVALLGFPHLSFFSKIRFGLQVFLSIRRSRWDRLDRLRAIEWVKRWGGEEGYKTLWKSLFELKFHRFREQVSAAWIWRRLRRIGLSRRSLFTEELGYLEGGVNRLLTALVDKIRLLGGVLFLNSEVIGIEDNRKKEVSKPAMKVTVAGGKEYNFDQVMMTVPLPYISRLVPGLPVEVAERYRCLANIGVVCVILKLKHSLTRNFWLNVQDQDIQLPGIIEFSNLNPLADHILYCPFYLPNDHADYNLPDDEMLKKVQGYCRKINPSFEDNWVIGHRVHRYDYAQPVCQPGFLDLLPPIETAIPGLYIVDTSYYYPEDRSISESIRTGKKVVEMVTRGNIANSPGEK